MPSHEEPSAPVTLTGVELAALLDASTLAEAVRDELVAATAWGVDADAPAKRVAAMSPLERTAIVEVMGRDAGVLGARYHGASLHAAGARPA